LDPAWILFIKLFGIIGTDRDWLEGVLGSLDLLEVFSILKDPIFVLVQLTLVRSGAGRVWDRLGVGWYVLLVW
jgi:hypothetical protein